MASKDELLSQSLDDISGKKAESKTDTSKGENKKSGLDMSLEVCTKPLNLLLSHEMIVRFLAGSGEKERRRKGNGW